MKVVKDKAGKPYSMNAKVYAPIYSALVPLIGGTLSKAQSSLTLCGGEVYCCLNFEVPLSKGRVKG